MLHKIPPKRILHMVYTRRTIGAAEALSLGLLSEVVPKASLNDAVEKILAHLLDRNRAALSGVKEYMGAAHTDPHGAARLASNLLACVLSSPRKLRGQGHGEGAAAKTHHRHRGRIGVIYGIRALEILRKTGIETHLVMSSAAELTMSYETDVKPKAVREMADVFHPIGDVGVDLVGLVRDHGHAHSSVLRAHDERDRLWGDRQSLVARGRCRAQGAPPARDRAPRDAAARRSLADDDATF